MARIPPAARVLPSRVFYGWYVAGGCAVLMLVGLGVGYYGLAVFLRPLQEAHGWSNSAVSGATGLYFSVSGIAAAVVGPSVDRAGPIRFIGGGTVVMAIGIAAIGYVDSVWQLNAVYTVVAAAFGVSTAVSVNAILTRWFVARRARAMSIAYTGVSVGGVILAPAGSELIDAGGLELATPVMAAIVVAVALPVLALVIVWDPAEMGLEPDGGVVTATSKREQLSEAIQQRRWSSREAARTAQFWAVLVGFLLVLSSQTGLVIHQISFLQDRLGSRSAAAFTLSVTAFGSILARLVVGTFADAVDTRWLTLVIFVVQATAILLLVNTENVAATYALTLVFGFTIGNVYMMQSLLVGEVFGMVSFGAIFGLISLAGQVGSGLGPILVGWLQDRTGSYAIPFTVVAIATYAAAAAILIVRPIPPPAASAARAGDRADAVAG